MGGRVDRMSIGHALPLAVAWLILIVAVTR